MRANTVCCAKITFSEESPREPRAAWLPYYWGVIPWIHANPRGRADRSVRPREDKPRWRPKGWRRRGWGSSWTEGAILLIKTPVINGVAPHDPGTLYARSFVSFKAWGGIGDLRWKRSRVKTKWGKNWGWRIRGKKKKKGRKKEYNRKTFDSTKDRINVGIWPSIAS